MCEILFILQRISVTSTILSNNVYDVSIVRLLLRSPKFWIIYTWSFSFFFLLLFFYLVYLICSLSFLFFFFSFLLLLLVPLDGIKKYLAWPDKINRSGGLPTNLMVNTNHSSQKTIACSKQIMGASKYFPVARPACQVYCSRTQAVHQRGHFVNIVQLVTSRLFYHCWTSYCTV